MTSVVSHDLQEPLAVLNAHLELLAKERRDSLDAQTQERLDSSISATRRIQEMISNLSSYLQLENG